MRGRTSRRSQTPEVTQPYRLLRLRRQHQVYFWVRVARPRWYIPRDVLKQGKEGEHTTLGRREVKKKRWGLWRVENEEDRYFRGGWINSVIRVFLHIPRARAHTRFCFSSSPWRPSFPELWLPCKRESPRYLRDACGLFAVKKKEKKINKEGPTSSVPHF